LSVSISDIQRHENFKEIFLDVERDIETDKANKSPALALQGFTETDIGKTTEMQYRKRYIAYV